MKKRKSAKERLYAYGSEVFGEPVNGDPETKPKVAKTQAEVEAANAEARRFAIAHNVDNINIYAVKKVGDELPQYIDSKTGKPYVAPKNTRSLPTSVPSNIGLSDIMSNEGHYWYTDMTTGHLVEVDPSAVSTHRFKKPVKEVANDLTTMQTAPKKTFASGGETGAGNNMSSWMSFAGMVPGLSDTIIDLFEGNKQYSDQPIVNAATMRNMSTPYSRKFAYGTSGTGGRQIEVEGKEAIETPNGQVSVVNGPSHENGGVDVVVPDGTKIYSDRIKIDGRTMKERKVAREQRLQRLDKLLSKNPNDKLLKGTIQRTIQTTGFEESKDMQIQKVADTAYNYSSPKFAMGGKTGSSYALGDDYIGDEDYLANIPTIDTSGVDPNLGMGKKAINIPLRTGTVTNTPDPQGYRATVGDYVGMAGNLFNAIAPLVNTENAAAASKPNINRFLGFGREAIESNSVGQSIAARLRTSTLTDIDTSSETARRRARNSTSSVNTLRAMDAVTDLGANQAKVSANDNFAKEMIGLLGQRGELTNLKDKMEMTGETARDIEDKADVDNYYSNKAQNLVNFGTNVQGIGRSLNTIKSNQVDSKLVSQLSKYGLEFDDNGNLVSVR